MTKATIPIGIQPGTKLLRIERSIGENVSRCASCQQWTDSYGNASDNTWIVWIHHNPDFTLGTYLTLYQDGHITNSTINEDGTETIFQVKDADE